MFLLKRLDFNKTNIIKGLIGAFFFSCFIYLEHFNLSFKLINSAFALSAFYLLFTLNRQALFYMGFFVGCLWFYWISFSFIHYDLHYLIPFIILGLGLFYGFLFLLIALYNHIIYRFLALVALSYFTPFGFNWLQLELPFVHTFFSIEKTAFIAVLLALVVFIALKKQYKLIALLPLVFALNINPLFNQQKPKKPHDLKIYMAQMNLSIDEKWDRNNLNEVIAHNLNAIDKAIVNNYDVVILPESAFPLSLNTQTQLLEELKEKSFEIDIITGALYKTPNHYNNSTYHFSKGFINTAHKVVLVPFGEAVPLPEQIRNFINNTFYNGAKDYEKAKAATDFEIQGVKFRNAICYETTTHEIFKNLNDVSFMISISNNAWFTPSIEPTLQKLLMQYYSKLYGVTIYAVANGSSNWVIGE
jgi:apolipoprotein N-acyltransferase